MKNTIIEQIKNTFNVELENSTKINHDPFKGHIEESDGKSWFTHDEATIVAMTDVVNNDAYRIVKIVADNNVGVETKTTPANFFTALEVKEVHGCLQLCVAKEDVRILKNKTTVATVIITNEGEAGWCLASAFPGEPGINIGKCLADACHKPGDMLFAREVPPEWLEHLVVL